MHSKIHVAVQERELSLQSAYEFVQDPAHGGFDIFIGAVRNHHLDRAVLGVSYDVFDSLCLIIFQTIAQSAQKTWGEGIRIFIEHYKGHLSVGGVSIIIAVSAAHREEAFAACRHILEAIKHQAPVWKQEHYTDGDSEWVKGHALCTHPTETAFLQFLENT